jgi:hypothetical protein
MDRVGYAVRLFWAEFSSTSRGRARVETNEITDLISPIEINYRTNVNNYSMSFLQLSLAH